MRTISIFLFLFMYCSLQLFAQGEPYHVWVNYNNGQKQTKGYLYKLDDHSILLADKLDPQKAAYVEADIGDIERLRVRRNGKLIKGAFLGAVAGFAAGSLLGILVDEVGCELSPDCATGYYSRSERKMFLRFIVTAAGIPVGIAIAKKSISIPLNGHQAVYEKEKERLTKYLIQY